MRNFVQSFRNWKQNFFLANPALFPPFPLLEKCSFTYDLILHYPKKSPFQSAIVDEVNSYLSKIHCRLQLGLVVVYQNRKKNIILQWKGGKIAALRNNPARIEATLIETLFLILPKSVIE